MSFQVFFKFVNGAVHNDMRQTMTCDIMLAHQIVNSHKLSVWLQQNYPQCIAHLILCQTGIAGNPHLYPKSVTEPEQNIDAVLILISNLLLQARIVNSYKTKQKNVKLIVKKNRRHQKMLKLNCNMKGFPYIHLFKTFQTG